MSLTPAARARIEARIDKIRADYESFAKELGDYNGRSVTGEHRDNAARRLRELREMLQLAVAMVLDLAEA